MRAALLSTLLFTLIGCDATGQDPPADPVQIELSAEGEAAVASSNAFGTRLFARTVAGRGDENLMLSPLSASVALTMLLNGTDGETYAQIHEMLGYGDADLAAINAGYGSLRQQLLDADPQVQLALANAVFYRDAFGPSIQVPFLDAMRTSFHARVEGLDFADQAATLDVVNGWASDNTNERIPTVLNEIDPDLVMLLMNALYFKGTWTTEFDADATRDLPFALADGSTADVPTMHSDVQARFAAGEDWTAVEMPYGRRNYSMIVAVPAEDDLTTFTAALADGQWDQILAGLGTDDTWSDVTVFLPRFTFENDEELNDPLQALGMTDAFTRRADLSRIAPGLVVSFVKQNTFVEVNEEGTEAAAVTTIGVELTSAGPSTPIFRADRPFVFAIRERTSNTLLFLGQVADPRA